MFIPLLSMDTIMGEARYLAEDSKMGGCYLAEASLMEVANWTAEHYWMAEGCWKEAAMRMVAHCYSEARKKKEERCY